MPDTLTFDAATHTYKFGARVLPNVTQIIREAGLIDDRYFTDEARERGRAVHVATALYDQGRLDDSKVREEYRGYVEAYKNYRSQSEWKVVAIEQRVWNADLGYAGTQDREVESCGCVGLEDLKTGAPVASTAIQTAAYERCDSKYPYYGLPGPRRAIHLRANGKFSVEVYDDHDDWDAFLAALTLRNWKLNHGVQTNGNGTDRTAG